MPATVHLSDIIEALEMQFEESLSYLDIDAGRSLPSLKIYSVRRRST